MHMLPNFIVCFPHCCHSSQKCLTTSMESPIWTTVHYNLREKTKVCCISRRLELFWIIDKLRKKYSPVKAFYIAAKKYFNALHLLFLSIRSTFGSTFTKYSFDDFIGTNIFVWIVSKANVCFIFYNGLSVFQLNAGRKRLLLERQKLNRPSVL